MIVTPVVVSPCSMARWIGAAPRYFGRIEAWTLRNPCAGIGQQCGGKNPSVRDDDAGVRMQRRDRVEKLGAADLHRLRKRQAKLARLHRHRRRLHLHPPSGRLVRLRDDERDLVLARQCFQRRDSEFRSAEEDESQSGAIVFAASESRSVSVVSCDPSLNTKYHRHVGIECKAYDHPPPKTDNRQPHVCVDVAVVVGA